MTETEFWDVIARAHVAEAGDTEALLACLETELHQLSNDELIHFERHFSHYFRAAYRADLWGAAYLINGGCSDDGFMDFRAWLIAQGREIYAAALANPDTLAAVAEADEAFLEEFLYLRSTIFCERTGLDTDEFSALVGTASGPATELVGDLSDWASDGDADEEQVRRLYPKLYERFWDE